MSLQRNECPKWLQTKQMKQNIVARVRCRQKGLLTRQYKHRVIETRYFAKGERKKHILKAAIKLNKRMQNPVIIWWRRWCFHHTKNFSTGCANVALKYSEQWIGYFSACQPCLFSHLIFQHNKANSFRERDNVLAI